VSAPLPRAVITKSFVDAEDAATYEPTALSQPGPADPLPIVYYEEDGRVEHTALLGDRPLPMAPLPMAPLAPAPLAPAPLAPAPPPIVAARPDEGPAWVGIATAVAIGIAVAAVLVGLYLLLA
jgi:hypothetical protein